MTRRNPEKGGEKISSQPENKGIEIGKAEEILDLKEMNFLELQNKKSQLEMTLSLLIRESPTEENKQKIKETETALKKIEKVFEKKKENLPEEEAEKAEQQIDQKSQELNVSAEQAPEPAKEEVREVAEQGEVAAEQAKKKIGFWKRLKNLKELGKTGVKMAYDTTTTIVGVKSLTDLVGVAFKRGDIYNYGEQRKTVKAEKEELNEIVEKVVTLLRERNQRTEETANKEEIVTGNKLLRETVAEFRQKLEKAKSISPEEKKEFKTILTKIISERSKKVETVEKETEDKTKKAMDLYLHTKINGLKIVKDALNTALSGMQLHAFRAPMYTAMSVLERVEKANLTFEKLKLKGEILTPEQEEERSKFAHIAKDLTLTATTEFIRSITFQSKTEERKKMGWKARSMDFITAFGQLARVLGLAGISIIDIMPKEGEGSIFDGNIFDRVKESTSDSINKLTDAYQSGGTLGVVGQVGKNYIENTEAILNMFGRRKPDGGSHKPDDSSAEQQDDSFAQQREYKEGYTSKDYQAEQPTQQEPVSPVTPEPEKVDLSDAIVRKGEGAEHALIRQLVKNPEEFGYKGDPADIAAVKTWAGGEAHRIALDQGIVKMEGGAMHEIKTGVADKIAYHLENVDGKVSVEEIDMTSGQVGAPETVNAYEYGYTNPPAVHEAVAAGPEVAAPPIEHQGPLTIDQEAMIPPVSQPLDTRLDLNPETAFLPADIKENIDQLNNLMNNDGKENEINKIINSLVNDYNHEPILNTNPEFHESLNKGLNYQLENLLENGGGLFKGHIGQKIEDIVQNITQVNGLSSEEASAFTKYLGGSDGIIKLDDMTRFMPNGQFDSARLQWTMQDFEQMIHSGKIPISPEFTPRWVNVVDEAGKKTPRLVDMRMVNNKVEVDFNHDGISDDIYTPEAAENIMKSFGEQEKIMREAVTEAAKAEAAQKFNEEVKAGGQRIEEMKQTDVSMPHEKGKIDIKQETLAGQATKQGIAKTFAPGQRPDDTASLQGTLSETKSTGENLVDEAFKKTFSHPSSTEEAAQAVSPSVENPSIVDNKVVPPPPSGRMPTLGGEGGVEEIPPPVETPPIMEGSPVPPPPSGRMPTLGGEGGKTEIPPVHHVDTVPESDNLDLPKVPGKSSAPVFPQAPKPFTPPDDLMPGSRTGVNMEFDPLPAPDNLSDSAAQTFDHLKNIARGVEGQPGPTIERAQALETLNRLKTSNPSDWEGILHDHQQMQDTILREQLVNERDQLVKELKQELNKQVPPVNKPVEVPHAASVVRPEAIPPTSQPPENLPAVESTSSDTSLISAIKQKFGEGNVENKIIGNKSYLTHTSARGEVTYLRPDGNKMTFEESAPIKLGEGGLTARDASDFFKNTQEAKQQAAKDLSDDMDDMIQQARGSR